MESPKSSDVTDGEKTMINSKEQSRTWSARIKAYQYALSIEYRQIPIDSRNCNGYEWVERLILMDVQHDVG